MLIRDEVIRAKERLGLYVRQGQTLRIEDMEGMQVADLVCFRADDPTERLSCNNTRVIHGRWLISVGDRLISDEGRTMASITADTVGVHHLSGGCCNQETNFARYRTKGPNCLDNLVEAAAELGVSRKDIPGAFCIFMNVIAHPDGKWEIKEPESAPGDHLDLRAEMDLFVAISNCPQERNACNGFRATPLRVQIHDRVDGPISQQRRHPSSHVRRSRAR